MFKIQQRMNGTEDEFVPEEEVEAGPGALKSLREKLKKAIEEKQEYLEGWQRSRADFANYKREQAAAHTENHERLVAQLVEEILPALDALELAVKHNDQTAKMLEGQFLASLKKIGVERFGAVGEEFDPHRHEALVKRNDDHVVQTVERSGYAVGSTIIRPAQVTI